MYQKTVTLIFTLVILEAVNCQIAPTQIPTRWRWSAYPNPQTEFEQCGRVEPSYVCDPNRIISFKGANALDSLITETFNGQLAPRPCNRGYMISVALVPEFYTTYEGTDRDQLLLETRRFAYGIYSGQWTFGVCGEWVLLFYAQAQNIVYTLTGPVARNSLDDGLIEQITLDARVYFAEGRERNVTRGLIQMVEDFRDVFQGKYTRRPYVRALPLVQDDPPSGTGSCVTPMMLTANVLIVLIVRFFRAL